MTNKKCTHCKEVKELNAFTNNVASVDGKASWCRECVSEYNRSKDRDMVHDGFGSENYFFGWDEVNVYI